MITKSLRGFITLFFLLGFNRYSFAQSDEYSSGPNFAIPITIAKTMDMRFFDLAISSSVPGTIIISPNNVNTLSFTGGVSMAAKSTVSAATFILTGQPFYSFNISIPVTCIFKNSTADSIIADSFTSFPFMVGVLNQGGSQIVKVGATFKLPASLPFGIYKNSTAAVTINYN